MARDLPAPVPPSRSPELANTELRDLETTPSNIIDAAITIVHPQLRDLIVAESRGHVYYPRGSEIKEVYFSEAHADELRAAKLDNDDVPSLTRTFADLFFIPNCLVVDQGMMAAGGQHGELYLRSMPGTLKTRWEYSATLGSGAINNSMLLLPPHSTNVLPTRPSTPEREHRRRAYYGNPPEEDEESAAMPIDPRVATYPNTVPFGHDPRMRTSPTNRRSPYQSHYSHTHGPSRQGPRNRMPSFSSAAGDDPRLLISNNDQSVKMFAIRPNTTLPSPVGSDSDGYQSSAPSTSAERMGGNRNSHRDHILKQAKRLARVGGTRFKTAVNHSSLSPDLKTMITVGDTTEVYLYEIVGGGSDFKQIGVYKGSTDSGFSTCWSHDGRKFAVASQDGQVTVWDHRSSNPMAVFHTSSQRGRSPSFTEDLHRTTHGAGDDGDWQMPDQDGFPMLMDPVTGSPSTGRSSSGNEAARVVKFSPAGSSRDLMVFTEENTNIHLVDARTFNSHIVLPVPFRTANNPDQQRRKGLDTGTWGIAGVDFDPTGDWLYAATERTVVEWDLRGVRKGGGGVWEMA